MTSTSLVHHLEAKLKDKELSTGPTYDFVPKIHDHHDLSRWFCESFHALSTQNSTKVYELANAFRKGVWDAVEAVEYVPSLDDLDIENPKLVSLVKEMVRIMKFRVVSYQRTTRRVVEYTQTMIQKARSMAHMIMKKQDELSRHIQAQALHIQQEKINHLPPTSLETLAPIQLETTMVATPTNLEGGAQVQVQVQGNSKKQVMDMLKKKALDMYKELGQLQDQRVHAVLCHDVAQVRVIDQQMKKLKTHTRAIMGARQHMASIVQDPTLETQLGKDGIKETLDRIEQSMTKKRVLDYDLYRQEVQNQIQEHASGMALYLGLKTQEEVLRLQHELVQEVCQVVSQVFEEGREEVLLLNQEMATFHRSLLLLQMPDNAMKYLEGMAKKYRGSIAKIQLSLLALFDKRS